MDWFKTLDRELFSDTGYESVKTKEGVTLKIEMPGCSHENTKVTFDNGILKVCWTRPGYEEKSRSFRLDRSLDASKIEGKMELGILTLKIPNSESSARIIPVSLVTGAGVEPALFRRMKAAHSRRMLTCENN